MKYYFALLFSLCGLIGSAQYMDSTVVYKGDTFCLHKLQQGETLYQLARDYDIKPRIMVLANMDKSAVLSLGELVRVPCKKTEGSSISELAPGEHVSSDEIVQRPGFTAHRVLPQETIYSLIRKYNVTEELFYEHNPTVKTEGLKEGSVIYFPANEGVLLEGGNVANTGGNQSAGEVPVGMTAEEVTTVELVTTEVEHTVKAQETVYSLCKVYDISEEEFFKRNPTVKTNGLKVGELVYISKKEERKVGAKPNEKAEGLTITGFSQVDSSSLADTSVFRIAILLPFNFAKNQAYMDEISEGREINMTAQTRFFMEFVQGFETAVDDLKKEGWSYQLFVYDTKSDSLAIKKIASKKEFKRMDLIVGPAYGYNFKYLAKLAKESGIPMVSPYGKRMSILSDNWKAIKLKSTVESRVSLLANYLINKHPEDHIILTHEGDLDKKLVESLQQKVIEHYLNEDSTNMNAPVVVKGVYEPISNLSKEKKNVVVSLSLKENFATRLCGKLQSKVSEFPVSVIGMEEWKDYKNIEASYWDSLQIVIAGNLDHRYTGNRDSTFFRNYFLAYATEPSYHSALAYDLVKAVVKPLKGNKFSPSLILDHPTEGLLSNYKFVQTGSLTGIDNVACRLYQYKDFGFEIIQLSEEE